MGFAGRRQNPHFGPARGSHLRKQERQMPASRCCRRHGSTATGRLTLALCIVPLLLEAAFSWVYPEHRDIAVLGLEKLDPAQRATLQKLFDEARVGHEARLCSQLADTTQALNPACIDYAAWTAISGDHSCSARDMLHNVLDTPWILNVAGVGAKLKMQLASAKRPYERVNALRNSDFSLLRADPEYVTRAQSNNAHFLLARPEVSIEPEAYARLVLGSSAEINALGAYSWYHLRAIAQAARLAHDNLASDVRSQIALAALADEAFALHFLEDSFASGHVAGTWGNSAVRKGTHDYYSEHGLEVVTWNHHRFVALGDANMQPADAERAAAAVRDSLAQLAGAFEGKVEVSESDIAKSNQADGFDVCHEARFPAAAGSRAEILGLVPVIEQTPVPALGAGKGELPRFRSELGGFVGLATAVNVGMLNGGFGSTVTGASVGGGLCLAFRVGLGLEGVLNQSSDGLAFLDVGVRQDSPVHGSAHVPGRSALAFRFRAPYWLIPGDLLLAAPVLAFTAPSKLQNMAVQSANGGLIPWQAGIATRIGRFQFVLGREVALSLYGYTSDQSVLLPTPGVEPVGATLIKLRSIRVDLPILEYRAFRTFSLDQSSGLAVQFCIGFDKPTDSSVVSPAGAPNPNLRTIVTGGVRVVFDWRHYVR